MSELRDWPRPLYEPGGAQPFVAFAVLGEFGDAGLDVSRSRHRVAGVPRGVNADIQDASTMEGVFDAPLIRRLHEGTPAFEAAISAPDVMLVQGAPVASETLNYLRDTVGIVTAATEIAGPGATVLDLNAFVLRTAADWRREAFEPEEGDPAAFVKIYAHAGKMSEMLTTRGMRTFGRPDLAFIGVERAWRDRAVEAMNRLIAAQARGHLVRDGAPLTAEGIPEGHVLRHAGSLQDPMFNNAHIRIARG